LLFIFLFNDDATLLSGRVQNWEKRRDEKLIYAFLTPFQREDAPAQILLFEIKELF